MHPPNGNGVNIFVFPTPTDAGPARDTPEKRPVVRASAPLATKRCGWSDCVKPVCPHEVNFCAYHACCERCRREGNGYHTYG